MSKKERRTQSMVWNSFEKPDENNLVTCNLCDKKMKYFGNTSNIRDHLKRKHFFIIPSKTTQTIESPSVENIIKEAILDISEEEEIPNEVGSIEIRDMNRSKETPTKSSPEKKSIGNLQERKVQLVKKPIQFSSSPVRNVPVYQTTHSVKEKDEFDVFGQYLAMKLRSLDKISCIYVQKAFNDVIFDAELGKYNVPQSVVEVNFEPQTTSPETSSSNSTTTQQIQLVQGSAVTLDNHQTE